MNDLLFYSLLVALLYYFFIYLPQQKQLTTTKFENKEIQTNLTTEELTQLEKDLTEKQEAITWLMTEQDKIKEQLLTTQDQITELKINKDSQQDLIQELEQAKEKLQVDYQQIHDQLTNLESEKGSLQVQLLAATKTKDQLAQELAQERSWWDKWNKNNETSFCSTSLTYSINRYFNIYRITDVSFNIEWKNKYLEYSGNISGGKKIIKCIWEHYRNQ